ncbi:hypothetical protein H9P43_005780 [Blastocladiella emersonii ATCC 22665]|nr:hypothetical protein H9P43_005780 [Blastocladiella emersonii ATCC 22665]
MASNSYGYPSGTDPTAQGTPIPMSQTGLAPAPVPLMMPQPTGVLAAAAAGSPDMNAPLLAMPVPMPVAGLGPSAFEPLPFIGGPGQQPPQQQPPGLFVPGSMQMPMPMMPAPGPMPPSPNTTSGAPSPHSLGAPEPNYGDIGGRPSSMVFAELPPPATTATPIVMPAAPTGGPALPPRPSAEGLPSVNVIAASPPAPSALQLALPGDAGAPAPSTSITVVPTVSSAFTTPPAAPVAATPAAVESAKPPSPTPASSSPAAPVELGPTRPLWQQRRGQLGAATLVFTILAAVLAIWGHVRFLAVGKQAGAPAYLSTVGVGSVVPLELFAIIAVVLFFLVAGRLLMRKPDEIVTLRFHRAHTLISAALTALMLVSASLLCITFSKQKAADGSVGGGLFTVACNADDVVGASAAVQTALGATCSTLRAATAFGYLAAVAWGATAVTAYTAWIEARKR